jgi:hypothetical protein
LCATSTRSKDILSSEKGEKLNVKSRLDGGSKRLSEIDLQISLMNQAKSTPEAICDAVMEQRANGFKAYKPTKIKLPEKQDIYNRAHLAHPINILIRDYNDFIGLVFRKMSKIDAGV